MLDFWIWIIRSQLGCSEDSGINRAWNRHCLLYGDLIALKSEWSFRLITIWMSFLFDLDYTIRGYFPPLVPQAYAKLSAGCVGGCAWVIWGTSNSIPPRYNVELDLLTLGRAKRRIAAIVPNDCCIWKNGRHEINLWGCSKSALAQSGSWPHTVIFGTGFCPMTPMDTYNHLP